MKALNPVTTATRETAAWWLDELRDQLAPGMPPEEITRRVRTAAARVSHVVLAVAARLAGVRFPGASVPTDWVLVDLIAAVEAARLAGGAS